jgi:hypothetical protein
MTAEIKANYLAANRKEEAYLCSVFLEAIRKQDGNKILEIAQSIWFIKGVLERAKPVDQERTYLLSLKEFFDSTGTRWTIRQIANYLQETKGITIEDNNEDGFSAIRRKCKELGVPIAKSRRGRRKKTT